MLRVQLVTFFGELVFCDLSTGVLFLQLQGLSTPWSPRFLQVNLSTFCLENLFKDVGPWARLCISCQKSKIQTHIHSSAPQIPVLTRSFSHLHADLVGPLPVSVGSNYLFTKVDRTTKWLEIIPLSSIFAASCAQALLSGWVSRFGVPSVLTSDR